MKRWKNYTKNEIVMKKYFFIVTMVNGKVKYNFEKVNSNNCENLVKKVYS